MAALTTALLTMTAAQTASSYMGQRRQADATIQQGAYEGGVYDANAGLADAQSADAIARGRTDEITRGQQTRQQIGSQRANAAASGVDVGSGSAADLQGQTAYLGALDQQTIKANAAREAWGYQVDATNNRTRATNARRGAQNTADSLRAGASSTLLTGALNLYAQGKQSGVWGQDDKKKATGPSVVPNRSQWSG